MVKNSDYHKIGLVGQGQFGKVYGGIHRHTGELVALKQLNTEQISTRQFLAEIHILFTLQHPNIVSSFALEHEDNNRYLISEYCEGGTLRTLIDSQYNISIEQKLKLIIDILDGLSYIHSENVIHRDLKPDNILLSFTSQGWDAKISDFGIAKIYNSKTDPSALQIGYTGSPAYMAPEQFYGKCTTASDIYAMGIILLELIANDRPFLGTPAEILKGHLNKTLQIPKEVPDCLYPIIKRSLEKLPQHRFATAKQMRSAILEATLNLSTYNDQLYVHIPKQELNYHLIDERKIDKDIRFLAMNHYCIYQCTKNQLIIDQYYFNTKTKTLNHKRNGIYGFNYQIIKLQRHGYGCILTARSVSEDNLYFQLHVQDNVEKKYSWYTSHLASDYCRNWQWCAVNQVVGLDEGFSIIDLSTDDNEIKVFISDFLTQQVLYIDSHHGVVIYQQEELNPEFTYFRFFNRRGNWNETYIIPTQITKVLTHDDRPYFFITREKNTNHLLLIDFKPYSIRRLPLNFRADFYLATKGGFICASEQGHIAFLDLSGQYLGEINLQFPLIAIASYTIKQFIVILKQEQELVRLFFQVEIDES